MTQMLVNVRVMAEYDLNTMRDRVRADVFVGEYPVGAYAVIELGDDLDPSMLGYAVKVHHDHLIKAAMKEWIEGPRRRQAQLQQQIDDLKVEIAIDAMPWWQRAHQWWLGIR